jgi:L-lactate dehydrogenase
VLGEHGDHQCIAWSLVHIGALPANQLVVTRAIDFENAVEQYKDEGQQIISSKGAIVFGIASIISKICFAVLFNTGELHPVSHYLPQFECAVSLPAVLGSKGAVQTVMPPLNGEENADLVHAAKAVRDMLHSLRDE